MEDKLQDSLNVDSDHVDAYKVKRVSASHRIAHEKDELSILWSPETKSVSHAPESVIGAIRVTCLDVWDHCLVAHLF